MFLIHLDVVDRGCLLFFGVVSLLAFFLDGFFDAHGTGFKGWLLGDGVPLFWSDQR